MRPRRGLQEERERPIRADRPEELTDVDEPDALHLGNVQAVVGVLCIGGAFVEGEISGDELDVLPLLSGRPEPGRIIAAVRSLLAEYDCGSRILVGLDPEPQAPQRSERAVGNQHDCGAGLSRRRRVFQLERTGTVLCVLGISRHAHADTAAEGEPAFRRRVKSLPARQRDRPRGRPGPEDEHPNHHRGRECGYLPVPHGASLAQSCRRKNTHASLSVKPTSAARSSCKL
jgi:hypothetical protein